MPFKLEIMRKYSVCNQKAFVQNFFAVISRRFPATRFCHRRQALVVVRTSGHFPLRLIGRRPTCSVQTSPAKFRRCVWHWSNTITRSPVISHLPRSAVTFHPYTGTAWSELIKRRLWVGLHRADSCTHLSVLPGEEHVRLYNRIEIFYPSPAFGKGSSGFTTAGGFRTMNVRYCFLGRNKNIHG